MYRCCMIVGIGPHQVIQEQGRQVEICWLLNLVACRACNQEFRYAYVFYSCATWSYTHTIFHKVWLIHPHKINARVGHVCNWLLDLIPNSLPGLAALGPPEWCTYVSMPRARFAPFPLSQGDRQSLGSDLDTCTPDPVHGEHYM
jgi:hypothetical protein